MAVFPIGAEPARENPHAAFIHARAVLDMARADLDQSGDSDDEIDFYVDAQTEALDSLLLMPAPDFASFAVKLELFFGQECQHLISKFSDPLIAALEAVPYTPGRPE